MGTVVGIAVLICVVFFTWLFLVEEPIWDSLKEVSSATDRTVCGRADGKQPGHRQKLTATENRQALR